MMKSKKLIAIAGLIGLSTVIFAQKSDPVLMKVGGEQVTLSEFEAIYKKNLQKDQKITQESLDEYLTLFTNFKLKVLAAKEAGVDTVRNFKIEYGGYRKQLGANYMKDSLSEVFFAKQLAERSQHDLEVAHILIKFTNECDTIAALKKATDIQKKLAKGLKWDDAVKQYSDDEFSKDKAGNLGWFTAGMWAYAFESAAYSVKNGAVAAPVRTKSGYHIIKRLNDRPARGEIKVAHIFVAAPIGDQSLVDAGSKKINDAYSKLRTGAAWNEVLMQFSEDRNSMGQGGEIPPFSIGQMVPSFENAAYSIKNLGDFSEPVQTNFGWHIIRLVDKKIPFKYETDADFYLKRIQKSSQMAPLVQSSFASKVKPELHVVEYPKFWTELNATFKMNNFTPIQIDSLPNQTLLKIGDNLYDVESFKSYYSSRMARNAELNYCNLKEKFYVPYVQSKVLENYELLLEDKYPAYKALMKEFKEGMMQFELMKSEVWDKSVEDTAGLRKYFLANRNNFMWGDRYIAEQYTSSDSSKLAALVPAIQKLNGDAKKIEKFVAKTNKKEHVLSVNTILEEKSDKNGLIATHIKNAKISPVYSTKYNFNVLVLSGERKAEPKELKEAKGSVVSHYQEYLEQEWLKSLRAKYPVEVDKKILYKLISR